MTIQDVLPSLLETIKEDLVLLLSSDLISFFVMGSVAKGKIKTTLQDVDFVLVIRDETSCAQLEQLASVLDSICASFSEKFNDTSFFWTSLDGPWEPQPIKQYNIGIHMAVLGLSQLYKRAFYQSNLAMTMYPKCKLLSGEHPLQIININHFEPRDALTNWVSVGWLKYMLMTGYFFLRRDLMPDFAFIGLLGYCVTSGCLNFDLASDLSSESGESSFINFLKAHSNIDALENPLSMLQNLDENNIFEIIGLFTNMINLLEKSSFPGNGG